MTSWLGLFPAADSSGGTGISWEREAFKRRVFDYQEMMDCDIIPLRTLLREEVG
jgi:hypothetical protein